MFHDFSILGIPENIFDYLQTEDDSIFHKPDPRVFETAKKWLETQSIEPDETIYVGDGLHDMKAATSAGFMFLGVCTGLITSDEFKKHNARAIESLKDLLS